MTDVGEAMLVGDGACPSLDGGTCHPYCQSAVAAHEMVMVALALAAMAVEVLAIRVEDDVDLADLSHRLQCPVNGGQAHVLLTIAEDATNLLGGSEVADVAECLGDRCALTRRTPTIY